MFVDKNGLVISPEAAFDFERKLQPDSVPVPPATGKKTPPAPPRTTIPSNEPQYTRYYLDVDIPSAGGESRFEEILEEIISPFNTQPGVTVKITLSIEVQSEHPFDKNIVRAVKENSTALGLGEGFDN